MRLVANSSTKIITFLDSISTTFSNLYIVTEVRCGSLTGEEAVADPLVQ